MMQMKFRFANRTLSPVYLKNELMTSSTLAEKAWHTESYNFEIEGTAVQIPPLSWLDITFSCS